MKVGKRSGSIVDQIVRAQGVKATSVTAATYTDPIQTLQLLGVSPVKICFMQTMCVNFTNVLMVLSDLRRPVSRCRLL